MLDIFFFFSSRRRHTRYWRDWSSDVCSSDLGKLVSSKDYISDIQKFYKASSIVKSDYKNIDAGRITSVEGWVEILDKNKNVVYVIGNKKDSKKVYTEDEILTLIEENSDKNKVDTTYLHSIDTFYVGKKKYYCMVKIPPGVINIDIDKEGSTERSEEHTSEL